ncbi:prolyl aminopeptidase [Streptomonospora sp. PA3]|uniref:prolyl aminopeptidase n=1 Tax=Streptomonospora sp. PA3 TaxID=2607326 RepID=UPI0012DE4904|nr:prolyl aminopeptidase [Streptomonospora sp. PA3]MUL41644.1 prolyl aminopeptidase [Streptomonospora sp. PA3]
MEDRNSAVEPYDSGLLEVPDGHVLYWETVGDPAGTPAVYLHGGPGAGCTRGARRLFGLGGFRAVLFDQRGCGRSRPPAGEPDADLSANTTAHLVADIERLREHLGIDRWIVVGNSWGVTLGLVYAQRHPERVLAMVLGAVTTGTRREIDWITRDMGRVFPREWERFVAAVPADERDGDLCAAYARLLAGPDPQTREEAARQWCAWEDTHVSLMPGWTPNPRYADPAFRMTFARLVTHYWSHGCFLADDQVIDAMDRLSGIPATLVHGRFDVSGPLDTAWRLHRAWPGSRLVVVDDAGHGGGGFTGELIAALRSFKAIDPSR